jgi:hypothetical protein
MKHKKEKLRAQVKSRFYYIFWGGATGIVLSGQILVATSYSRMANAMEAFILSSIVDSKSLTSNEVLSLDHTF